jgi:putative membrane protein
MIWIVSAVVLIVVVALKIIPPPQTRPSFIYLLPHFIGGINAACAVLLIISLIFIKNKNIQAHKITNVVTFILSSIFLVLYILFHLYEKDTKFGDADHNGLLTAVELAAVGSVRYIYYFILLTHIVLAGVVLPLILFSWI